MNDVQSRVFLIGDGPSAGPATEVIKGEIGEIQAAKAQGVQSILMCSRTGESHGSATVHFNQQLTDFSDRAYPQIIHGEALLTNAWVHPGSRGKGLGSIALGIATMTSKELGVQHHMAFMDPDNSTGVNFLLSNGFVSEAIMTVDEGTMLFVERVYRLDIPGINSIPEFDVTGNQQIAKVLQQDPEGKSNAERYKKVFRLGYSLVGSERDGDDTWEIFMKIRPKSVVDISSYSGRKYVMRNRNITPDKELSEAETSLVRKLVDEENTSNDDHMLDSSKIDFSNTTPQLALRLDGNLATFNSSTWIADEGVKILEVGSVITTYEARSQGLGELHLREFYASIGETPAYMVTNVPAIRKIGQNMSHQEYSPSDLPQELFNAINSVAPLREDDIIIGNATFQNLTN